MPENMVKTSYLPDLLQTSAAFLIAGYIAGFLHGKWYYGGWMDKFGDPPASNPAYERFILLFTSMPYVAAGLTVGFISGFGLPQPTRILTRLWGAVVLFLFLSRNSYLDLCFFAPSALGAFAVSTGLSVLYFWLLARVGNKTEAVEQIPNRS